MIKINDPDRHLNGIISHIYKANVALEDYQKNAKYQDGASRLRICGFLRRETAFLKSHLIHFSLLNKKDYNYYSLPYEGDTILFGNTRVRDFADGSSEIVPVSKQLIESCQKLESVCGPVKVVYGQCGSPSGTHRDLKKHRRCTAVDFILTGVEPSEWLKYLIEKKDSLPDNVRLKVFPYYVHLELKNRQWICRSRYRFGFTSCMGFAGKLQVTVN